MKAQQLGLWQKPEPLPLHHHIEIHFDDGTREIVCTASVRMIEVRTKPANYAGFVGGAQTREECSLCSPKEKGK
jgi:hypothetical protein